MQHLGRVLGSGTRVSRAKEDVCRSRPGQNPQEDYEESLQTPDPSPGPSFPHLGGEYGDSEGHNSEGRVAEAHLEG